jgi:hypothetical protein
MAISKEKAQQLTGEEQFQVIMLEKRIDQWVVEHPGIAFGIPSGISQRIRDEIERRYCAVGWTVTYHSDQRDGDFWTFE